MRAKNVSARQATSSLEVLLNHLEWSVPVYLATITAKIRWFTPAILSATLCFRRRQMSELAHKESLFTNTQF